ncbi:MAG: HlyD family efflux transporter periplasmic adaptor subunit [Pseudohongiellaceae bacterium]
MINLFLRVVVVTCIVPGILTACKEQELSLVGQLMSDRVELVAESNEPITAIPVHEGDQLQQGDTVLVQFPTRIELRIEEMRAGLGGLEALLAEQINGPRVETIEAARLTLGDAEDEAAFRAAELERLNRLRERNLTSVESVDLANRQRDAADAAVALAAVRLKELENGTRPEQIEQTRQKIEQTRVQQQALELDLQRLTVRAPVAGVVDSLPFEVGERPRIGGVVAVMLTGSQPLARVYVPEPLRLQLKVGDSVSLSVDGLRDNLVGRVIRIASEASFTPYFALTEQERGRLSYIAEIALPELAQRLPEGLPVQVLLNLSVIPSVNLP